MFQSVDGRDAEYEKHCFVLTTHGMCAMHGYRQNTVHAINVKHSLHWNSLFPILSLSCAHNACCSPQLRSEHTHTRTHIAVVIVLFVVNELVVGSERCTYY